MLSIRDLLDRIESHSFVGRHAELQLMQKQLSPVTNHWNIVHFHGISGIGKTALLNRLMKQAGPDMVYINTDQFIQSPKQFLDEMARNLDELYNENDKISINHMKLNTLDHIISRLNAIATKQPPLILLFDSFELWNPIIDWLFESFIPKLSSDIRIISAGRESLEGKQIMTNPWGLLIKNILLRPLKKADVIQYLETVGVYDRALQHTIVKLSNGIPFAMTLCVMFANKGEQQIEFTDLKQIIRVLCQSVFDKLEVTAKDRHLLEAASVVGKFDMELLSHITNRKFDYVEFERFCTIPIIMNGRDGWSIQEGIRNWIQSDFKEYSPELYIQFKKRALEVLHRRWKQADLLKRRSLFLENVYALENPLLQEYYFLGDETVYDIRTAQREDIPTIMDIWKNRHLNTLRSVNDGTEQEKLILSVWELEPDAIKAFWEGDCIVGFTAIVTFTKEARDIFMRNDLYTNYLRKTNTEMNERLFWIGATAKKDDYEALNAIYRYFFEQLMDNCLCTVMFPTDYDVSGLLSIGFKRLPWATSATPSGKVFHMLQADFRETSLVQLLTTTFPNKARKDVTISEAISWMKKVLLSFHDFELNQELLEDSLVIMGIGEHASSGKAVRLSITNAMKEIAKRTERDRIKMRALELAYISKIGPNEIVAERLHLSISTYYRYIRKGIEKVALYFVNRDGP